MTISERIHASCVALNGNGVVIRGPSGIGKSDLALCLIDGGAVLVSDDYVMVSKAESAILAAPPQPIAGLLEIRGIGLLTIPFVADVPVCLVVDLVDPKEAPRMPEANETHIELLPGCPVSAVRLAAHDASNPAKIRFAVSSLVEGTIRTSL